MAVELVGRGVDLERLRAYVGALEDGVPGVALVSGEAGIGKSRLIDELVRGLDEENCQVLAGRCVDLGTSGPPYAAVTSALRHAPGSMADEALDALTGVVEVPRARLFDLVRAVVTGLGRRRPTVLVIEDLHWVDQATRDMLVFLLAAAREGRWGLVVTFRDQQLQVRPRLRDLVEHLGRERHVERVALCELDRDEVAELASSLAGGPLSHVDVAELHRRSGGIPLLVEELVAAREHADPSAISPQLRALFLARLRPLGTTASHVLRLAALVGADIHEDLLARASGATPEVVEVALDDAIVAGAVVIGPDGYRFRHELLRELVCEDMSPARRAEAHRVLAEAMAADAGADHAALAHHWYEARAHAPAAEAALQAADAAQRVHAHAAEHGHLERVLGLWDHLTDDARARVGGHGEVLARAAEAAHLAGASPRAVALGLDRAAAATTDPVARIAGLERLARYQWVAGEGRSAEATSEQALAALTDDVPADLQAQVLSGHAWLLVAAGHAARARPFAESARAAAERSGDLRQRCRAMLAWAWAHCEAAAARTALADARAIAEDLDADEELGRAGVVAFSMAAAAGSARDRARLARDGRHLARERGMAGSYEVTFAAWEAEARLDQGEWSAAARLMDEAISGAPSGMPAQFLAAQQARLAAARGDSGLVDRCLAAVQAMSGGSPPQPGPRITALLAAAEARAWEDDLVAAGDLVGRASSLPNEAFGGLAWVCAAIRARVIADAHGPGLEVEAPGVALPDPVTEPEDPRDRAWERTWRAEQARVEAPRDTQPWREALAAWDAAGDPYRTGYAGWRLAQVLLQDRSGRGEARELMDHAARSAAALQARPLAAAVERTAAMARLEVGDGGASIPPSESAARAAGLTPREMQVLALVATGLTNRDVAEHLVISPRTVGTHVSRVLRKLGAARRTEAVAVARRRGLLEP